jgi:hypothetical protein
LNSLLLTRRVDADTASWVQTFFGRSTTAPPVARRLARRATRRPSARRVAELLDDRISADTLTPGEGSVPQDVVDDKHVPTTCRVAELHAKPAIPETTLADWQPPAQHVPSKGNRLAHLDD